MPLQSVGKPIPQTIDSSSKNDMYIMDFPTSHRLRHKKTTSAQVTTLTLYNSGFYQPQLDSMAHLHLHPETPPASPMLRPGSVPPALPRPRSLPMAPAPAPRAAAERVQRVVGRPVGLLQMGLCWRKFPKISGMNHDIMENSIGGSMENH